MLFIRSLFKFSFSELVFNSTIYCISYPNPSCRLLVKGRDSRNQTLWESWKFPIWSVEIRFQPIRVRVRVDPFSTLDSVIYLDGGTAFVVHSFFVSVCKYVLLFCYGCFVRMFGISSIRQCRGRKKSEGQNISAICFKKYFLWYCDRNIA